jgi:tetratricopeptide (TPR) repeat protein
MHIVWTIALSMVVGWQAEPAVLQQAIIDLGDGKIAVREQATQTLWKAGLAAEPLLKKALASDDAEVRFRAKSLLDRFQYGVFADTPVEVMQLIQQFRNGDLNVRSNVLQQLAKLRRFETMFALIETESDPNQRQQLNQRVAQETNGLFFQLLLDERFEEADKLVELVAINDQGLLTLVTYRLLRGTLDEQLARWKTADGKPIDAKAARRLTYGLRAKGDWAGARAMATTTGDVALTRAIAFEQSDWAALAANEDWHSPRLPEPWNNANPTGNYQLIEKLGFGAAFFRLAGNQERSRELLQQVQQLANMAPETRSHAFEAFCLNDRTSDGIALLRSYNTAASFEMLNYLQRYDDALAMANWKPETKFDKAWLESLPGEAAQPQAKLIQRFRLACSLARSLHSLGLKPPALELFKFLESEARQGSDQSASQQMWTQLALAEYRAGLRESAFEHIALSNTEASSYQFALRSFFTTRYEEAESWLQIMQRESKPPSFQQALGRIHRLLSFPPPKDEPAEAFAQQVEQALQLIPQLPEMNRLTVQGAIGATCAAREQPELARKCWEPLAVKSMLAALRLGDLEARQQRWTEAVKRYEQAWQQDQQQVLALYLAGLCFIKAGNAEAGRKQCDRASLLAIASRTRHQLALGLQERDYRDEALLQWQILERIGPFEQWELNDSLRHQSDLLEEKDPLRAAALSERAMVATLRTSTSYLELESMVRVPFQIHKMRAQGLVAEAKWEAVQREITLAAAVHPADVRLAEDVVPLLDKAGRRDEAEQLFKRQCEGLEKAIRAYPENAFHFNNLAWLQARCHRQLDEALQHAQRAVALQPETASYLDTLAEVHFHRGNREEAVRLSKQAVAMAPRMRTLREQLARFERAELPR